MSARCLGCGAGNEWIEGKATHERCAARAAEQHVEAALADARRRYGWPTEDR